MQHRLALSPADRESLAPTGVLRAALNASNSALTQRDAASGEWRGIAADLARELARWCGLQVQLLPYTSAGQVVEAGRQDAWDVAFLAVDPQRAAEFLFTEAYVTIEGTYLVRANSGLQAVGDMDRAGVRITVSANSGYDLFLTRNLKYAQLVRTASAAEAFEAMLREGYEASAGVRDNLLRFAARRPDLRVMEGHFMLIPQAMALPHRATAVLHHVDDFIGQVKRNGFVTQSLARSGGAAS